MWATERPKKNPQLAVVSFRGMAVASPERTPAPARTPRRKALAVAALTATVLVALVVVVFALSGAKLASDASALARLEIQPLGGTLKHVEAFGPGGRSVPLVVSHNRLTPRHRLKPGEQISVVVRVRRPGWIGWALGDERTERLTVTTPVAQVSTPWMTVRTGSDVRIGFEDAVSKVDYGSPGHLTRRTLASPSKSISLGPQAPTGSVEVAAAPRSWETVGKPTPVSWFPRSRFPVMASYPATSGGITPAGTIYLTFSKPVGDVLGNARPRLLPATAGRWRETDSHTIAFTPSGFGVPLGSQLRMQLPHEVSVIAAGQSSLRTTSQLDWTVQPGSTLRLQQLLAEGGYLPLVWRPSGHPVAPTASAQVQAAVEPPAGNFSWRYHNTPGALRALWSTGRPNTITRGALMKFENINNMTADGVAGPAVWRLLIENTIAHKRLHEGYSYVLVHREVPQTMTLWHAGRTILTSAANTGISGSETESGTFPVFEHIPEGTMSGTNPDGSHYEDPGIKWISYFNGGDALHNFDRASFGTPQSLGCVELPLDASAKLWPYTPIGTLVTVES
jgi:hypothetical protein